MLEFKNPPIILKMWILSEARDLCKKIEEICPIFGCHVALTGGLLTKEGERKDLDLIFYRIRHINKINLTSLLLQLEKIGIKDIRGGNWRYVGYYENKQVDLLFPEEKDLE